MDSAGYIEAERELSELVAKKKDLDLQIANIEVSIYSIEGTYLEEAVFGNVIKGFDALKSDITRSTSRQRKINNSDRIFSQSSSTHKDNVTEDERGNKNKKRREGDLVASFTSHIGNGVTPTRKR